MPLSHKSDGMNNMRDGQANNELNPWDRKAETRLATQTTYAAKPAIL